MPASTFCANGWDGSSGITLLVKNSTLIHEEGSPGDITLGLTFLEQFTMYFDHTTESPLIKIAASSKAARGVTS